jgi:hypothetical protein
MKDEQKTFLKKELWTLTIGAAFGRASVYKDGNPNDYGLSLEKQAFKTDLRAYIDQKLLPQYQSSGISDEAHLSNIHSLCDFSCSHGHLLTNAQLNFGVGQKMLNLWLKYLWCLGEIETPPHFPVDRRIQEIMKYPEITPWTQFQDHAPYMAIIRYAREHFPKYNSISEMELDLYERAATIASKKSARKTKVIQ